MGCTKSFEQRSCVESPSGARRNSRLVEELVAHG